MGLNHDFLLLDRDVDGEWEKLRFIHDSRAIQLHDDFVRYMQDTLAWIPTKNPGQGPHHGLCMWGPTLIEADGAGVAEHVFGGWAKLLAAGPPRLLLTGGFSWAVEDDAPPPVGEKVTQLEGGYDRLEFNRDEVVGVLRQLVEWCGQVRSGAGRLYIYHGGV